MYWMCDKMTRMNLYSSMIQHINDRLPWKRDTVSALPSLCSCSSVCCAGPHSGRPNQPAERTWITKKRFRCDSHINCHQWRDADLFTICDTLHSGWSSSAPARPPQDLQDTRRQQWLPHGRITGISYLWNLVKYLSRTSCRHIAPITSFAVLHLSWTASIYRCQIK